MNSKNEVIVLFNGYSYKDVEHGDTMRANCTCTLIRGRCGLNVIVDTMTAWDGPRILEALAAQGLQSKDITMVVSTHGHSDHIGCNYLFTQSKYHFVGACPSHGDKYYDFFDNVKELRLDDLGEIVLQRTPGHTLSCISVLVHNTQFDGVVGICGDLFERSDDVDNATIWQNAGSEDVITQRNERLRMAEMCTYIVPGHGAMFRINEAIRAKLKNDVSK